MGTTGQKRGLRTFMREQAKRKQEGSLRRASASILGRDWRIPTGAIDLDYGLGGGAKVGAVTMFWGQKSGGKTSSALRTCGEAQHLCRNCYRRASADAWLIYSDLSLEDIADVEDLFEKVQDAKSTGEVFTRREAHTSLVDDGYELHLTEDYAAVYKKGEAIAVVSHQGGDVEPVEPSDEELEEDENARWSAKGYCDCFAKGIYEPDEPDLDRLMDFGFIEGKKKPSKNSRAHRAGAQAWRTAMELNSYEEVVVAWFDEEMTLDLVWAQKLGVDTDRLLLVWSNSAEEAIDILAGLIFTGEVDLLVIDSIAQLTPKKELEASAEEWQQGLAARLINKAIRRWNKEAANVARYGGRPVTQIWINQERTKIGVMFGSPATMPGGMGQGFQVVAEVKFRHSKTEVIEEQYGAKNESISMPVWEEFAFKVTKSKGGSGVGLRDVKGSYRQAMRATDTYDSGAVLDWERVFKMALHYLVKQEKKGSSSTYKLGTREYTSQAAILRDLRDDPAFYAVVRQSLLEDVMLRGR